MKNVFLSLAILFSANVFAQDLGEVDEIWDDENFEDLLEDELDSMLDLAPKGTEFSLIVAMAEFWGVEGMRELALEEGIYVGRDQSGNACVMQLVSDEDDVGYSYGLETDYYQVFQGRMLDGNNNLAPVSEELKDLYQGELVMSDEKNSILGFKIKMNLEKLKTVQDEYLSEELMESFVKKIDLDGGDSYDDVELESTCRLHVPVKL